MPVSACQCLSVEPVLFSTALPHGMKNDGFIFNSEYSELNGSLIVYSVGQGIGNGKTGFADGH